MDCELKTCPFCGGEAQVRYNALYGFSPWCSKIECILSQLIAGYKTERDAVEAWNTRTSGWIPVTERLPEKDDLYLCVDDGIVIRIHFNADFEEFGFWDAKYDSATLGAIDTEWNKIGTVTHWMPMPEPPEEV